MCSLITNTSVELIGERCDKLEYVSISDISGISTILPLQYCKSLKIINSRCSYVPQSHAKKLLSKKPDLLIGNSVEYSFKDIVNFYN